MTQKIQFDRGNDGNTYLGSKGAVRPTQHYTIINTNNDGGMPADCFITFRITEACDLHCSYCHWREGAHYKRDDIMASIDRLFEFASKSNLKSLCFYYHGGEPTRHPNIIEVLKHVKHKSAETGIIAYNELQTNFTIPTVTLVKMLEYVDMIDVSLHFLEIRNKPRKYENFVNNWQHLVENNIPVHNFDVMLEYIPEDELEAFYALVEQFLEYDNIDNSEMVYRFGYNYAYNKETEIQHKAFFLKHNKTNQTYDIDGTLYTTNDLFRVGLDCTGWWCEAGIRSLTVNGDGNTFNCGIHMTNHVRGHPDTPFTNLVTDPLAATKLSILYRTGTKCRWDYCGGDFYLRRHKL